MRRFQSYRSTVDGRNLWFVFDTFEKRPVAGPFAWKMIDRVVATANRDGHVEAVHA